jgi:lysosomal alpha-mannosidase
MVHRQLFRLSVIKMQINSSVSFLQKRWQEQTETKKAAVKQLVEEGRLEFISGGWCMNDEAGTHYNDIIDQMTWGMR